MNKRGLSAAAGVALTGFFLWLAARNVNLSEVWGLMLAASWRWLPLMLATSLMDITIRARRWGLLLTKDGRRPSTGLLFRLEAIGLAVNNVLFLRIGELARAFLAARELEIPVATALSSVAVERALDVAALLTLFSVAAARAPHLVAAPIRRLALAALAGAIGALIALALAERPLAPGGSWERRLRGWPKIHDLIGQLAAGAAVLRSARAAAEAVALSLALWAVDAVLYWAGARALGLGEFLSYSRSILVLSWAGAAAAIPAAPGGFGTFETAVKSIIEAFGVSPQQALGYAVFNHMTMYLFVTALGLVFLYRVGFSVAELRQALDGKDKAAR